jgi:hypothetical protein
MNHDMDNLEEIDTVNDALEILDYGTAENI